MTMRPRGNGILIGGGALLAGVLTFGVVLGKTIGGSSVVDVVSTAPDLPVQTSANTEPTSIDGTSTDLTPSGAHVDPSLSPEVLSLAVDRAPFQEDRLRPSSPYRLPGSEPERAPRAEAPAPPPAPDFQLIGTVSGPNGGWAIIRVGEGEPQMVAVGESMEGYTLNNVRGERAVMASTDRSVSLALVGPSPQVATRNQGRNQGNQANQGRGGGAAAAQGRQGGAGGAIEIPAALVQQLQGQGINAGAILQQLGRGGNATQMIQRLTNAAGGNVAVPVDGRGGGGRGGAAR